MIHGVKRIVKKKNKVFLKIKKNFTEKGKKQQLPKNTATAVKDSYWIESILTNYRDLMKRSILFRASLMFSMEEA